MTALTRSRSRTGGFPVLPIRAWMTIAAERRRLREMSDQQLKDIGLTPLKARREAARPFWDLPTGRY